MTLIKKLDEILEQFSYRTLVLALILMLGLSLVNITFRWFNITFLWIDPVVRHLVFFSAFLGGSLATGSSKHIGIDLITKFLDKPQFTIYKKWHLRLVSLAATVVLIWLTVTSIDFAQVEFQYGRAHFLNIHSGYLVSIIPFGFCLISLRFFFRFVLSFSLDENSHA